MLLIHGLGGNWRSWNLILAELAAEREVIAIDLPGFGETPPLPGEVSSRTLADAVTDFLRTTILPVLMRSEVPWGLGFARTRLPWRRIRRGCIA